MTAQELIYQVLAGGLLGTLGQGMRVVVGLKKMRDHAASTQTNMRAMFDASQLLVSLFIGFIAGALTLLATGEGGAQGLDKDQMWLLVGAGYAGTDAIEALLNRYLPAGRRDAVPAPADAEPPVDAPPPAYG